MANFELPMKHVTKHAVLVAYAYVRYALQGSEALVLAATKRGVDAPTDMGEKNCGTCTFINPGDAKWCTVCASPFDDVDMHDEVPADLHLPTQAASGEEEQLKLALKRSLQDQDIIPLSEDQTKEPATDALRGVAVENLAEQIALRHGWDAKPLKAWLYTLVDNRVSITRKELEQERSSSRQSPITEKQWNDIWKTVDNTFAAHGYHEALPGPDTKPGGTQQPQGQLGEPAEPREEVKAEAPGGGAPLVGEGMIQHILQKDRSFRELAQKRFVLTTTGNSITGCDAKSTQAGERERIGQLCFNYIQHRIVGLLDEWRQVEVLDSNLVAVDGWFKGWEELQEMISKSIPFKEMVSKNEELKAAIWRAEQIIKDGLGPTQEEIDLAAKKRQSGTRHQ